jgi:hypothetical protein
MPCMSCGTVLETIERWCHVCVAPQDHREDEALENVTEYRRMLKELMREGDDWRPRRLEWAASSVVTVFQARHAAPETPLDKAHNVPPIREHASSLVAEREARAQAARVEARRSAELHLQRQEREQEEHQQRSRARMQNWAQAEFWGRHERDHARREERLNGLLEWASTHGIRFTDVPSLSVMSGFAGRTLRSWSG